jgi:hypothetical protein
LADRVALAWSRIAGRAALAADPVVALLIAKDIAAWTSLKLSPATLERPIGCWPGGQMFRRRGALDGSFTTRRLWCYAKGEERSEENHGNG